MRKPVKGKYADERSGQDGEGGAGLGIQDLARHAGVTARTVTRFENGGNASLETLTKIKQALDAAGITYVPENGGPATVRPPRRSPG